MQLRPVTGRSHQLRVHMKELGHPISKHLFYARLLCVCLCVCARAHVYEYVHTRTSYYAIALPYRWVFVAYTFWMCACSVHACVRCVWPTVYAYISACCTYEVTRTCYQKAFVCINMDYGLHTYIHTHTHTHIYISHTHTHIYIHICSGISVHT